MVVYTLRNRFCGSVWGTKIQLVGNDRFDGRTQKRIFHHKFIKGFSYIYNSVVFNTNEIKEFCQPEISKPKWEWHTEQAWRLRRRCRDNTGASGWSTGGTKQLLQRIVARRSIHIFSPSRMNTSRITLSVLCNFEKKNTKPLCVTSPLMTIPVDVADDCK